MDKDIIYSFYSKISPKNMNSKLFYFFCATIIFLTSFILSSIFTGKYFLITQFCIVFFVPLWPIVYIWMSESFYSTYNENIQPLFFSRDTNAGYEWYKQNAQDMFCFRKKNFAYTFILWIISVLILYAMPKPFESHSANIVGRLGISVILFIAVCSVYIVVCNWNILNKLSKREVKTDFYSKGYKYISQIKNYFIKCEIIIVFAYFIVFLGIMFSPYQLNILLIVWIVFMTMVPVGALTLTLMSIKSITDKSKQISLNKICDSIDVTNITDEYEASTNKSIHLIEYRDYLDNYRNKKLDRPSILAFTATLLGVVAQIVIALLSLL